jgi:hypothetical protein
MKSHLLSLLLRRARTVVALIGVIVLLGGSTAIAAMVDPGSSPRTVTPTRVLDTRSGIGAPKAPLGPDKTLNAHGPPGTNLTVPGIRGATAIVVNITVVNGTANSYLTIYANKDKLPRTSTINWVDRSQIANGATVAIHPDHIVTLYNSAGSGVPGPVARRRAAAGAGHFSASTSRRSRVRSDGPLARRGRCRGGVAARSIEGAASAGWCAG